MSNRLKSLRTLQNQSLLSEVKWYQFTSIRDPSLGSGFHSSLHKVFDFDGGLWREEVWPKPIAPNQKSFLLPLLSVSTYYTTLGFIGNRWVDRWAYSVLWSWSKEEGWSQMMVMFPLSSYLQDNQFMPGMTYSQMKTWSSIYNNVIFSNLSPVLFHCGYLLTRQWHLNCMIPPLLSWDCKWAWYSMLFLNRPN